MLRRLEIEDYALIARADVEFAAGATTFTGETGSGKTMLVGALDFALGARAGADAVRRGARKAVVTLTFDPDDALRARFAADGFPLDAGESGTIVREMTDAGRSNVRLNGRPATASYLREIGAFLAEIVGQHEAQRLLSPGYHLELLDRFAGAAALRLRDEAAGAYAAMRASQALLERLAGDARQAEERCEGARYALAEIERARLDPKERDRLARRRAYLDNAERIAMALQTAREALAGEEGSAVANAGAAAAALAAVGELDPQLADAAARAAALQADANDLAGEISRTLDGGEYDAGEIEAINARLAQMERVTRTYGDVESALAYAARAREIVDEYENADETLARTRAELAAHERALAEAATALSAARKKAAATLRRRVEAEFGDLALGTARFDVSLEPLERTGASGAERIEFLFGANAGEPALPLARVVSGGERSRVLLALVVALAQAREGSAAMVFDEIDAGIGGATASAVGARIGELARRGQVVCVTHLAQLATWADRHYVLDKLERKGATAIAVREIDGKADREAEIARMLSGESHDVALRHARALLAASRR
jgi:DNA repair protein RecN (Recombination protein N)